MFILCLSLPLSVFFYLRTSRSYVVIIILIVFFYSFPQSLFLHTTAAFLTRPSFSIALSFLFSLFLSIFLSSPAFSPCFTLYLRPFPFPALPFHSFSVIVVSFYFLPLHYLSSFSPVVTPSFYLPSFPQIPPSIRTFSIPSPLSLSVLTPPALSLILSTPHFPFLPLSLPVIPTSFNPPIFSRPSSPFPLPLLVVGPSSKYLFHRRRKSKR